MARAKLTSLKNLRSEESQFQLRLVAAYCFMVLMFALLIGRFVWLQVFQYQHFATLAQNNRISLVPILPNRGLILDRNGVVLAQNYSSYTLEVTPSKIENLDATIASLGQLVNITPRDLKRFKKFLEDSKEFETVPLKVRLTDEEAARVAANIWRFPGVEVKARLFRDYPYHELTSHGDNMQTVARCEAQEPPARTLHARPGFFGEIGNPLRIRPIAQDHGQMAQMGQLQAAPPGGHGEKRLAAEDEGMLVLWRFLAQGGQRIHGEGRAGALALHAAGGDAGDAAHRQLHQAQPVGEGQHAVSRLVRRLARRHEQHALQAQQFARLHGHAHVARVDGIEAAA